MRSNSTKTRPFQAASSGTADVEPKPRRPMARDKLDLKQADLTVIVFVFIMVLYEYDV